MYRGAGHYGRGVGVCVYMYVYRESTIRKRSGRVYGPRGDGRVPVKEPSVVTINVSPETDES